MTLLFFRFVNFCQKIYKQTLLKKEIHSRRLHFHRKHIIVLNYLKYRDMDM